VKEITFLKQNAGKWQKFESILSLKTGSNPDLVADLFIQLTDDLSYARTNYPNSKTTHYLNALASKAHQEIYKNKKEKKSRILSFWKFELPMLFKQVHRQLFYSFLITVIATLIGAVSAAYDEDFVRLILGDTYVNQTLENISKGDPLAIYKSMDSGNMFFMITINNIRVSFLCFAAGLVLSMGTVYLLFTNGVMLGAFQYFFYAKGLLLQSVLVIWIHGTLEISAIIIAGAAGLTMGNSILFPGTYSRFESFRMGAKKGVKIVIGLLPIFITAGFLESFVTRHSEMPAWLSVSIIMISLLFIIGYFIIYPIHLNRNLTKVNADEPGKN
jgi:uncharacterized membrane protein SpoIIM required for sporulation